VILELLICAECFEWAWQHPRAGWVLAEALVNNYDLTLAHIAWPPWVVA
jgi:hypothetical protein